MTCLSLCGANSGSRLTVPQYQPVCANGPDLLFAYKETIDIASSLTLLLNPGCPTVARPEDGPFPADDPTQLIVCKTDVEQGLLIADGHRFPCRTAVYCSQNRAFIADSDSSLFAQRLNVI